DHPAVRNAYIRAFVASAFHGATTSVVRLMLDSAFMALTSALRQSNDVQYPGLENFARTLRTLERRLGVNTDDMITYFYVCDSCWRMHTHSQIAELESPYCRADGCEGVLYTVKRLQDGTEKRTPTKIVSYVSPITAIRLMLSRPGKFEQLQHWRKEGDAPAHGIPPSKDRGNAIRKHPNVPLTDIYDGWRWRAIQAGLERRQGGPWQVEDVTVRELEQRFVSLECGLVFQLNVDWYSITNSSYSTGAVYLTCLNNPRSVRNLQEETYLVYTLPGANEPNTGQLSHVFKPFVNAFLKLGRGVKIHVHGEPGTRTVHGVLDHQVSDLPASRKLQGLASFTSKQFMCPEDKTTYFSLCSSSSFDPGTYEARSEWRYIKYAYRYQMVDEDHQEIIFEHRGIRWSELYLLPDWMPVQSGVIDYMHAMFLGEYLMSFLFTWIGTYVNRLARSARQPLETLKKFLGRVWWPSSIGRIPTSIVSAGSGKADQWRTLIAILFVGVFDAWQIDGEIPDRNAPRHAANTKAYAAHKTREKQLRDRLREHLETTVDQPTEEDYKRVDNATICRNYREHYGALLKFTVAVRTLSTQEIAPVSIDRGTDTLCNSFQCWADMGCPMTPYCHFATHMKPQFYCLGPIAYTTAAWAYERNNGHLAKMNHNGHTGGELEATKMRSWWKRIRITDLINAIEALPRPHTYEDADSLEMLHNSLKGDMKARRGTLETYLDRVSMDGKSPRIEFPRQSQKENLRDIERKAGLPLYATTLRLLRELWENHADLVPDVVAGQNSTAYHGRIQSYTTVTVSKRRYGVSTRTRGHSSRYGYIDARIPVQVDYLFTTSQEAPDGTMCTAHIALVRRFVRDATLPEMPWALWATDLGVETWHEELFGEVEAVEMNRLSGQFILASLT
ncbi:hypothetical protein BV25DRAFT_1778317, partial [Artomyces pyxidatus]